MKLIHINTDTIVAKIDDGKVIILDDLLQAFLEDKGIQIPAFLQTKYHDKHFVYPEDDEFADAFKNVYYPFSMDNEKYKWIKNEN